MTISKTQEALINIRKKLEAFPVEDFSHDSTSYIDIEAELKTLISQIAEIPQDQREPLLPFIHDIEHVVEEKRAIVEEKLSDIKEKLKSSNEVQKGIRTYNKNTTSR